MAKGVSYRIYSTLNSGSLHLKPKLNAPPVAFQFLSNIKLVGQHFLLSFHCVTMTRQHYLIITHKDRL